MARNAGGRDRGVRLPGVYAAAAVWHATFHRRFCVRGLGGDCWGCARAEAFTAGEPVSLPADELRCVLARLHQTPLAWAFDDVWFILDADDRVSVAEVAERGA